MNTKAKGINAERDLVHKFWATQEWTAIRVAGSGSSRYPSPDVIAGNRLRKLAIECKVSSEDKKYFSYDEIDQLKQYCDLFGAEPWIAIRLNRSSWHFLTLEDIEKTNNGYVISSEIASRRGLLFEELIK